MGTMGLVVQQVAAWVAVTVMVSVTLWMTRRRGERTMNAERRTSNAERRTLNAEGEGMKVRPLEEGELREVGMLDPDGAVFLAPLHVAEGMRAAMALEIGRTRPGVQGYSDGLARAAGYLAACAEFERLWSELGEKGRAVGEKEEVRGEK